MRMAGLARARLRHRRRARSGRALSLRMRAAIGLSCSGSSSAPMARTALSNRSICAGKASRKKPEMRSVTSTRGRPSLASGHDLEAGDAARRRCPTSGCAPINASAWAMSSPPVRMLEVPQTESAKARGPVAVILEVAVEHERSADFRPSSQARRRRHGAGVDRIEIAAGRQHVEPAARRRAGRAGRDEAAVEAAQQRRRSRRRRRRSTAGARFASMTSSTALRARPAGPRRSRAGDQLRRQQFQPLDRVAVGAPGVGADVRRARPGAGRSTASPRSAVERIESAELQIGGQRADQRLIAALRLLPRGTRASATTRSRRAAARPAIGRRCAGRRGSAFPSGRRGRSSSLRQRRVGIVGLGRCRNPRPCPSRCAQIEDLRLRRSRQRRGSTPRRLVVFVDQRFEVLQRAVALGAGQRRRQVIDDHRDGAALGLRALAGIVDDERIEMRQRPEHRFGIAGLATAPAPCPAAIRDCRACRCG